MKLRVNLFKVLVIALLIGNLAVLGIVGYNKSAESTALFMLENKIEILGQYYQSITQKIIDEYNEILIASGNKVLDLEKLIDNLQVELDERKSIDLTEVNRIKEANLYIINATEGYSGSGTHVKINGESYILTCAHLLKGDDDKIVAQDDNGFYHFTEIIKVNQAMDLMLLKTGTIEDIAYLEISDIFPEEGSEVTAIGNPSGLVNMITEGIIAQIDKSNYIVTNKIYFGNSGGALIYRGKVVGVVSQIAAFTQITPWGVVAQNYGIVVKLEHILTFLKDVK